MTIIQQHQMLFLAQAKPNPLPSKSFSIFVCLGLSIKSVHTSVIFIDFIDFATLEKRIESGFSLILFISFCQQNTDSHQAPKNLMGIHAYTISYANISNHPPNVITVDGKFG